MGENSSIEWTDHTLNPWVGCQKVSPGCQFCYAERDMTRKPRWENTWGPPQTSTRLKTSEANWKKPLTWDRKAEEEGRRYKVFCASLADVFERNDLLLDWRHELWRLMQSTPHLDWLLLTKRPENVLDMVPYMWFKEGWHGYTGWPANVWLGVSVETPEYFNRIVELSGIPAVVKFVSYEPALGLVDFAPALAVGWVDWLISGGESGYNPRPAETDWFRQARDDCQRFGVPFFHKQNGGSRKIGGVWGGRELDGRTWDEFPQVTVRQLQF